ncbi:LacI family DNA-binding transcriptional regulator [Cellulomonas phragmiteti]|nr:LacI family DNA-binding transcriptional regulator [Cellulomonas phragmiteti]
MHDVAARAGVSIKTVSNVVNGYPYIRAETREKVEAAIAALGYRVNVVARNLRRGRTGMIGLAVPVLSLPYFAELADSVIRAAEERGLTVLIEQTGGVRARELEVLHGQRRHFTDGLIYSPLALGPDDAHELDGLDHPLVLLGERIFDAPADHVTMSNVEGARAATQHLLDLGRRRIAVVGGDPHETVGAAALRVQGYAAALADNGVPFDPALLGDAGLWRRASGAQSMARLLDADLGVDAVLGLSDVLALGALHTLHLRRIDVPGRIAVIGFDDIEEAAFSAPTLSTVHPGREQIATTAVDLLLERIEGRDPGAPFRRVVADFAVVPRESTLGRGGPA